MDPDSTAALAVLCHTLAPLVAIPVFLIIFGIPAWMIVKLAAIRAGERLNKNDAAAMQDMAARLHQMDERMAMLETILDSQVPAWRGDVDNAGGTYARQAG
jgi:phage shock protein B